MKISDTTKIIVRHSNKTQDEKSPNNTPWIKYWQDKTKREIPKLCPCCGETPNEDNPMVGAHVEEYILSAYTNKPRYITPTCHRCNVTYKGANSNQLFSVDKSDLLELEE